MQETRTYLKVNPLQGQKKQSSQNISDTKINIFKEKRKEKWAIQISKFKQE